MFSFKNNNNKKMHLVFQARYLEAEAGGSLFKVQPGLLFNTNLGHLVNACKVAM